MVARHEGVRAPLEEVARWPSPCTPSASGSAAAGRSSSTACAAPRTRASTCSRVSPPWRTCGSGATTRSRGRRCCTRRSRAVEIISALPDDAVVVQDIPLLVETGQAGSFDLVLVVEADRETRVARLVARGLAEDDARARIAAQATDE